MKQLSLFPQPDPKVQEAPAYWKLYVDGAARNNPGPAGAGIVILKDEAVVDKQGCYLGSKTNNQAEYCALLLGLFYIKGHMDKDDLVLIISDSQLLVRQLKGEYRVKEPHLKPLYALALAMLKDLRYDVAHVLREENEQADEQANLAVDKKTPIPAQFLELLQRHEIHI